MKKQLRSHEGANAVEFALVLPMLVVLIFGGIWGGIALNHDLSLSTAAREGARYGATHALTPPAPPNATWFTEVLTRVENETTGSLGPGISNARICVAFIDASGTVTAYERTWPGGDASVPGPCYSDGLSAHARVQVTTARDSDIQAVLVNIPVTLHSEAVARYEREVS